MVIIGDVHGKFNQYEKITASLGNEHSVQIGDMGVGFPSHEWQPKFVSRDYFFRGNHDNPKADFSLSCLGKYGIEHFLDISLFFLAGAWSIDQVYRTPGVDWWPEEELSYYELDKAYEEYVAVKPKLMLSHDCPTSISPLFIGPYAKHHKTRTGQALQAMFETHQPEYWIFGHYHTSKTIQRDPTVFICLDELETVRVTNKGRLSVSPC